MASAFSTCTVHIVGLGLMGGSLALALRGRVGRITAEDVDPAVLAAAQESGVIDGIGRTAHAQIVVLAIPADRIVDVIPSLELAPGTLVIDLGSTKTRICETLDRLPEHVEAVGGHPMCGLAENGYRHATGTLYQRARFVLCETARTTDHARSWAENVARAVGGVPLWMDRAHHDAVTALVSHLPHLLSFALMRLAMETAAEDQALYALAAGGFDGATRLARTDAAMITGMFNTNATQLRRVTAQLRQHLDELDALLDDTPALHEELNEIVAARRSYSSGYGERPIT